MMVVLKSKLIGEFIQNPENLNKRLDSRGFKFSKNSKREFSSILSSNNNDIKILISKLEEFVNN